jgi:hypothetical protein
MAARVNALACCVAEENANRESEQQPPNVVADHEGRVAKEITHYISPVSELFDHVDINAAVFG